MKGHIKLVMAANTATMAPIYLKIEFWQSSHDHRDGHKIGKKECKYDKIE
jgi:hypothetical protein